MISIPSRCATREGVTRVEECLDGNSLKRRRAGGASDTPGSRPALFMLTQGRSSAKRSGFEMGIKTVYALSASAKRLCELVDVSVEASIGSSPFGGDSFRGAAVTTCLRRSLVFASSP